MNETLILVWAAIAVVGIIGVIIVKYYYNDKESEEIDFSNLTTRNPLQEMISGDKKNNNDAKDSTQNSSNPIPNYFSKDDEPSITLRKEGTKAEKEFNPYIVPETEKDNLTRNISYSSQNQVLINYEDNVQKFQEPITETQRDIMSQRNNINDEDSKHELKDLFTIDELIKESKRKDDEREKESKTINKDLEDNSDIKESIRRRKDGEEESLIEEITENGETKDNKDIKQSIERMHEIANAIKSSNGNDSATAEENAKEEITEISQPKSITDAVIKKEEEKDKETTIQETLTPIDDNDEKSETINDVINKKEIKEPTIKEPTLKSPTKVEEDSVSILSGADDDYEFGASIDSSNLFEDENGELSDLDYRKDLAKITNTFRNSSIVKDIRERLSPESNEEPDLNEEFIRNVNSYSENPIYDDYDEYEPIINETHVGYFDETPEDRLRQENTRKVFEIAKDNSASEAVTEEKAMATPKAIPEKSSLKVIINSNEEVLRKGDEIIYKHDGETYSSKVYAINGDDIKVKYRRQDITIKPSDIKKIY